MINESGLHSLIFNSKLESAERFKKWVTSEVLPSIRKTGQYQLPTLVAKQIALLNENDLNFKVVEYIRRFHSRVAKSLIVACGENKDTSYKRVNSWKKGYISGTADIYIQTPSLEYNGFAIELKMSKGNGLLSKAQRGMLEEYKLTGCKTLVSDDYDIVTRAIPASIVLGGSSHSRQ